MSIGIFTWNLGGKHDGYLFGKRYFFAPQNHGLFLPLQDIICVTNKKVKLAKNEIFNCFNTDSINPCVLITLDQFLDIFLLFLWVIVFNIADLSIVATFIFCFRCRKRCSLSCVCKTEEIFILKILTDFISDPKRFVIYVRKSVVYTYDEQETRTLLSSDHESVVYWKILECQSKYLIDRHCTVLWFTSFLFLKPKFYFFHTGKCLPRLNSELNSF